MRATFGIALAVAVTAATRAVPLAGDFDGSKPLLRATLQAMDCVTGEDCLRGLAADIGAPTFMRIDFDQEAVIGPKRTSPVLFMDKTAQQVLLQGTELGFGWTIALDQSSGTISATLVNREGAVVLFDACTAQ